MSEHRGRGGEIFAVAMDGVGILCVEREPDHASGGEAASEFFEPRNRRLIDGAEHGAHALGVDVLEVVTKFREGIIDTTLEMDLSDLEETGFALGIEEKERREDRAFFQGESDRCAGGRIF